MNNQTKIKTIKDEFVAIILTNIVFKAYFILNY